MVDSETAASGNAVPLSKSKETEKESENDKKWGREVIEFGFCMVPSLLLQAQRRLGLNPTQLAILIQLSDFWWQHERKPYPSKATLAERLGLSPRQVQRHIAELESAALVKRRQQTASHGGKTTNIYDLDGLVNRLRELEPEFREVKENARIARRAVTQPRYRRKQSGTEKQPAGELPGSQEAEPRAHTERQRRTRGVQRGT